MRSKIFTLSLVSLALLATVGCARRQKVATAPDTAPPPAVTETVPIPGPTPEAPAAPTPAPDPLGGDLASVNEYLRRQGLADVFFDYDRASLTEQGREQLARSAEVLRRYPQFLVTLEGHCDDRGTPEYNLALGERRAFTARGYLTSLGIDEGRLQTMSYGEERPVCTDSDETCWRQNRRAHPVVTGRSGG